MVVNRGTGRMAVQICGGRGRDLTYCGDGLDSTFTMKEIKLNFYYLHNNIHLVGF
jgi:hypothetical protein